MDHIAPIDRATSPPLRTSSSSSSLSSCLDIPSDSSDVGGELKLLYESLVDEGETPLSAAIEISLNRAFKEHQLLENESAIPDGGETQTTTTTDSSSTTTPEVADKDIPSIDVNDIHSTSKFYGHPLSPEQAEELVPPGEGGLTWNATIVPDDFIVNGKLRSGLNRSDFDLQEQCIKPRRASLPLTATEFLSSLTYVNNRIIFHGVLNGWPSLTTLEVMQVEQRRHHPTAIPTPKEVWNGQLLWSRTWKQDSGEDNSRHSTTDVKPRLLPDPSRVYRVTLRGAPWTGRGWSPTSPGHVFWYEALRTPSPRLSYGTDIIRALSSDERCTHVHMLSHRYAVQRESPRDRLTYHSLCLLEWEHGQYCTVVEAAYLNGIGGYKGRSNWYHDKNEPMTHLYKHFPPELICPWRTEQAEIRCYDIPVQSLSEFQDYVQQYVGPTQRFLDPQVTFSHSARLSFRSRQHIAQYLINYIMRDTTYAELKRNCQTFTADLCSFLAGKKNVAPFHPVSRIEYQNRTYLFLYDSGMYETKLEKKRRKSQKVVMSMTNSTATS
jgi:hypothetical protein